MKKFIKILLCVVMAFIFVVPFTACEPNNENNDNNVYEVQCAPCSVKEIYNFNDDVAKKLFMFKMSAQANAFPVVKVDGKLLSKIEFVTAEDLTEGEHTIEFSTGDDFTVKDVEEREGQMVQVIYPYKRSITLKVKVSSSYADIYDFDYREQNGLWVYIMEADWYEEMLNTKDYKNK